MQRIQSGNEFAEEENVVLKFFFVTTDADGKFYLCNNGVQDVFHSSYAEQLLAHLVSKSPYSLEVIVNLSVIE